MEGKWTPLKPVRWNAIPQAIRHIHVKGAIPCHSHRCRLRSPCTLTLALTLALTLTLTLAGVQMFRRLASRGTVKAAALAGGVALSAYVLNSAAVQAAEEPSIFVINGFYMAMREKFTKPGTSIYYYLVEWDPATPWVAQVAPGELPGCLSAASVASVASPLAWL